MRPRVVGSFPFALGPALLGGGPLLCFPRHIVAYVFGGLGRVVRLRHADERVALAGDHTAEARRL